MSSDDSSSDDEDQFYDAPEYVEPAEGPAEQHGTPKGREGPEEPGTGRQEAGQEDEKAAADQDAATDTGGGGPGDDDDRGAPVVVDAVGAPPPHVGFPSPYDAPGQARGQEEEEARLGVPHQRRPSASNSSVSGSDAGGHSSSRSSSPRSSPPPSAPAPASPMPARPPRPDAAAVAAAARPSGPPPPLPPKPASGPPPPLPARKHLTAEEEEAAMLRNMVRNLDTGEVCDIGQVHSFFPEVAKAVTLSDWLEERSDDAKDDLASARGDGGGGGGGGSSGDDADIKEEKQGFISALRSVFSRNYNSMRLDKEGARNAVRVRCRRKQVQDMPDLRLIQDIAHHTGPVWAAKFSPDGNYLATAGQDSIVRVWAVVGSQAAADMARQREEEAAAVGGPETAETAEAAAAAAAAAAAFEIPADLGGRRVVVPTPFRMFSGHKNDVIHLAWSKSNFLLSASIDRTVRLWHVSRPKCLRLFQHPDYVTSVSFHPVEDKFFVSGSFDRKLRIWDITNHAVIEWAQTASVITAATFSPTGRMVVAGLITGQVVFYQAEGLKYFTQVDAKNRHGKYKKGCKVTGIEYSSDGKRVLVTTNDNRVRLYDIEDFSCLVKYKGHENGELQIRATFDEDNKRVICGSDDAQVYVWDVAPQHEDGSGGGREKSRPKRNEAYETFKAHSNTVTTAQFAPRAAVALSPPSEAFRRPVAQLICTTGYDGTLRFYENREPPRAV